MSRERGRLRGSAALAILVVIIAAMAGVAVAPHIGAAVTAEEIRSSRTALARLERFAGRATQVEDRNARIRASSDHLKLLLSAETTGIAGAQLQKVLLDRVTRHKGTARAVQVQRPETDGSLTRISTLLTARIDITGLRDLLHDLETGLPLLFVTNLSVQSLDTESRNGTPRMLDVRMQVSGYLAKRAGS